MSATPNQLDEIFRQVSEYFISHPVISVSPTKGDPPDQYEITYTITGMCKTGGGEIVESKEHTVEVAIPFGFPHFPPSCKPKSGIFHPDFDPAAICLGDFWEQDCPLSDLIIYIGKMINGEFYSTTNAFNENAAEWYLKNSGKFPLTQIKWGTDNSPQSSPHDRAHKIDTLDDIDLTTNFDFLSLEEEEENQDITLNTSLPEVDSSDTINFELLHQLKSQKRYYTLLKTCESNTQPSDELTRLCQHARDEIRKVEKLHRDGKKFENKGDAQIALEKYQQITTTVIDFPTIESDIQRITQTLALLADISPDRTLGFSEPYASSESEDHDESQDKPPKSPRKTKATKYQTPNDLFLTKSGGNKNYPLFIFLGLLTIGTGCIGYLWYSYTDKLSNAETTYAQCSKFQANDQFEAAKLSCEKALQQVSQVKVIHQTRANRLEESILEILQSEKLAQGLAGNVLLDGRYIPKAGAQTLLSIKQKINEAETLFIQEKWQAAQQLYGNVLAEAADNDYLDDLTHKYIVKYIEQKRLMAEFRMAYDPALILIQNSKWEKAIEKLLQAQKILISLSESDRGQYSEKLQDVLQKSQFAHLKEQGDLSFTGSDWLSAIAAYNLALASGQESALPPESIDAIRNNIKRAELYTTIYKGNKAFASGAWDDAIKAYSKASDLMTGNQNVPGETASDINILKLTRIILQASIIRDRQTVQSLLDNNDLMGARRTYQQILNDITTSSFGDEEEFINISAETNTAIQTLDEKIYLTKKIEYLKNNYQSFFVANYPDASPENLTNPVITKTKETESSLVFRMQCTEKDGGRPLTLVMLYAFDKKTGKWSFFSTN